MRQKAGENVLEVTNNTIAIMRLDDLALESTNYVLMQYVDFIACGYNERAVNRGG